ncbi:MAG TPA: hypothetical protein VF518_15960, partial [Polyangia bacterium]
MKKLRFLLVLALLCQLSSVVSVSATPLSTLRYVAPGGACAGLTPCYASVQAAVDAAASGDEIRIATGAYTGVSTTNGVPQMAYIATSLTLRGGYKADFSDRDPQLYPTTLDAGGLGRVLYIQGSSPSSLIDVTLDGLELTGGNWGSSEYVAYNDASGLSNSWWQAPAGGGIHAKNANLSIFNSRLYANVTFNGLGSGLFQHYGALVLQNSTVSGNKGTGNPCCEPLLGDSGGGLFLLQVDASIRNTSILNNEAGYGDDVNHATFAYGGGIFL